mmetsp:Transcript_17489/g.37814  ORF Transcript_17489/g.37814 Transcript_17489/m.37814 type:complete len:145 (-) Transcript_17489:15-449(-)
MDEDEDDGHFDDTSVRYRCAHPRMESPPPSPPPLTIMVSSVAASSHSSDLSVLFKNIRSKSKEMHPFPQYNGSQTSFTFTSNTTEVLGNSKARVGSLISTVKDAQEKFSDEKENFSLSQGRDIITVAFSHNKVLVKHLIKAIVL